MPLSALIKDNSLLLLLTVATIFSGVWLHRHRKKLRLSVAAAWLLALFHTLIGVLCVKVFAGLESLDFSSMSGMSLFGAVFFLPLFYWGGAKLSKRKAADVFDAFAPCVVFTLLCARINCLLSNCCLGRYLPDGSGRRFPTREAEILFYMILLIWLIWGRKKKIPGSIYPVYMVAYGGFRFLIEGFRVSDSQSLLHISHLWAAVTFCLGLSIYLEVKRKQARRKTHV